MRSLDCDNMCIISIWTIRNYDIRFLYKMLKSRVNFGLWGRSGNRSVGSLERDKMHIISIWTIRDYDIRFLGPKKRNILGT